MFTTLSFTDAIKKCKPLSKLPLNPEAISQLNSGKVFYYFAEPPAWSCWPYFPIGAHRGIVKDLREKGVIVPNSVKVIIEINETEKHKTGTYMHDCFGHTLLYLNNPKASNECEDAINFIQNLKGGD